jgi:cyclopropane-fatty-acyl-phospholipid synthase
MSRGFRRVSAQNVPIYSITKEKLKTTLVMWYKSILEKNQMPDFLIRWGIRRNCKKRIADETQGDLENQHERFMQFVTGLRKRPIAEDTKAANEQHYEVPTKFFRYVLGKNLKYSSAYWKPSTTTLDQAEDDMLAITVERAGLRDGQKILECGCGWGSLSLYMAKRFPSSQITAVSNSRTQKKFIDKEAAKRGLTNLNVITADMNEFQTEEKFDGIVSVEMFEHMRNYESLLEKLSSFLHPDGHLFVHIFTHRELAYFYEVKDESDWMSKHFFTGGVMPSDHLLLYFADNFKVENHWRVNGTHYARTSEAWLQNMDKHKEQIMPLFEETYGADQALKWWVYWRIFFMSCAELFAFNGGNEWFVSHYRFAKRSTAISKEKISKTELEGTWKQ